MTYGKIAALAKKLYDLAVKNPEVLQLATTVTLSMAGVLMVKSLAQTPQTPAVTVAKDAKTSQTPLEPNLPSSTLQLMLAVTGYKLAETEFDMFKWSGRHIIRTDEQYEVLRAAINAKKSILAKVCDESNPSFTDHVELQRKLTECISSLSKGMPETIGARLIFALAERNLAKSQLDSHMLTECQLDSHLLTRLHPSYRNHKYCHTKACAICGKYDDFYTKACALSKNFYDKCKTLHRACEDPYIANDAERQEYLFERIEKLSTELSMRTSEHLL